MAVAALHEIANLGTRRLGNDCAAVAAVCLEVGDGVHMNRTLIAKCDSCQAQNERALKSHPAASICKGLPVKCSSMNIKMIRRQNLLQLEKFEGALERIADKTGIPASYLSQVKSGYRNMGDKNAEKIEIGYKQLPGWLDTPFLPVKVGSTLGDAPSIESLASVNMSVRETAFITLFTSLSPSEQGKIIGEMTTMLAQGSENEPRFSRALALHKISTRDPNERNPHSRSSKKGRTAND